MTHIRLSRADFKNMRGFRRLQGRFFSLSFGPLPSRSSPGTAVVVSSKAVGSAVGRNTLKRRARAVFRDITPDLRAGVAYVAYAKKGAGGAPFTDIRSDILELVARAKSAR